MQYLKLNDGTELMNSYVALSSGKLFFYIQSGITIIEAFNLMSDPEKTCVIQYIGGDNINEYNNFTTLISISCETPGVISGVLSA